MATMTSSSDDRFELVDPEGARNLTTRAQGRALLARALARLDSGRAIEVDLSGLAALTPSFADEFFGGLLEGLGEGRFKDSVRIRGASETCRVLIRAVLADRRARPRSATGGAR